MAAAMEHAGEAIAILDADHVIRYVNPQYERQTGFSAEEVITARIQADQERMRLAEAMEHASDSIEILDRHGQILYVNPAYERRTGTPACRRTAPDCGCRKWP